MLMHWVRYPRLLVPVLALGIHSMLPSLGAQPVEGDEGCGRCFSCATCICSMGVHTCSYTRVTRALLVGNPRKALWITLSSMMLRCLW